jgi:ankyrin repeat protein
MVVLHIQMGKTALHYAAEHGHLHILTDLYDSVVAEVTPPILSDVSF